MEDRLIGFRGNVKRFKLFSLNPCFNGRQTDSLKFEYIIAEVVGES